MGQIADIRKTLDAIEAFSPKVTALWAAIAALHKERAELRAAGMDVGVRAPVLDEALPSLPKLPEGIATSDTAIETMQSSGPTAAPFLPLAPKLPPAAPAPAPESAPDDGLDKMPAGLDRRS